MWICLFLLHFYQLLFPTFCSTIVWCICVCMHAFTVMSNILGRCGQIILNASTIPGPSVHGTFKARILEWFGISSSNGSSDSGIKPVSCISCTGRFFYHCVTWQPIHLELLCLLGQLLLLLFFYYYYYYYMFLSLVVFFALRSTLSDINGAIPAFDCVCMICIFSILYFYQPISLYLEWVSCSVKREVSHVF